MLRRNCRWGIENIDPVGLPLVALPPCGRHFLAIDHEETFGFLEEMPVFEKLLQQDFGDPIGLSLFDPVLTKTLKVSIQ